MASMKNAGFTSSGLVALGLFAMIGCGESHTGGDASADSGGTSDFAGAYVMDACGPADGHALQVLLYDVAVPDCSADTSRRTLAFYLYGPVFPITPGTTVTSSSASGATGSATLCPGGTPPCQTSGDFTITFDTFVDGTSASGSYTVTWGDGSSDAGTFGAEWCTVGPVICG